MNIPLVCNVLCSIRILYVLTCEWCREWYSVWSWSFHSGVVLLPTVSLSWQLHHYSQSQQTMHVISSQMPFITVGCHRWQTWMLCKPICWKKKLKEFSFRELWCEGSGNSRIFLFIYFVNFLTVQIWLLYFYWIICIFYSETVMFSGLKLQYENLTTWNQ